MRRCFFISLLLIYLFTVLIYHIAHYAIYMKEVNIYSPQDYGFKHSKIRRPPSFIAHIGSLHLSPKTYETVQIVFNNLSQVIKPCATIITGSITDGISDLGWTFFSQLIKSSSFDIIQFPILASAGKEDHAFLKEPSKYYTNFFNITKFNVFSFIHLSNNSQGEQITDNAKITVFNPLTFPYPPHPQSIFSKPSNSLIKELDNEINSNFNIHPEEFSITTSSYPIHSIIDSNHEFISSITNTKFYLTGNSFNTQFQTHIYNHTYEFVAAPLSKQSKIGLLTDDNSILSYNTIDFDEDYLYVLSYPSYFYQTGQSFRIRLIVFEIHNLTLVVYINGIYRGRLEPDFITDNYIIYGMNIKLPKGKHTLFIDGDISVKRTFNVGEGNYTADPTFILRNKYIYDIFNSGLFLITLLIIHFINIHASKIYIIYILMIVLPIYFTWENGQIFIIWTWGFISNFSMKINSIYSNTFSMIESTMIVNSLLLSKNRSKTKGFHNFILKESPLLIGFMICFYLIYIYGGIKSLITSPLIVIFLLSQIFVVKLYYKFTKVD